MRVLPLRLCLCFFSAGSIKFTLTFFFSYLIFFLRVLKMRENLFFENLRFGFLKR